MRFWSFYGELKVSLSQIDVLSIVFQKLQKKDADLMCLNRREFQRIRTTQAWSPFVFSIARGTASRPWCKGIRDLLE